MAMRAANPIVVGSFVFGALALGVLAIVLFGGMHLFSRTVRVVVFFSSSIAGLEVGAPVTFKGMRIGRVEGMRLDVDVLHQASWMPVYLDLDFSQVSWTNGFSGGRQTDLQRAVDAGLRAQLVPQSLVSGQLYVNLDLLPQTAARLTRRPNEVLEIPSIPSEMQDFKDQFRQLNLPELGLQTRKTLLSMQYALDELQSKVGPLADSLHDTASTTAAAVRGLQTDAGRTLADIDRLANEGRRQIEVDGPELDKLLQRATQTADHADAMVASLNEMTSPRSPLREDLQASLRDLAASASSLRDLTHDLDRNPLGTLLRQDKP
jgi:phospholipid/cholesterol/gamma-HCH transport system substrate-binding protein